jgi:general secretion pathway protein D
MEEPLTTGNPNSNHLSGLFQPAGLLPKLAKSPLAWLLAGCLLFAPARGRAQQAAPAQPAPATQPAATANSQPAAKASPAAEPNAQQKGDAETSYLKGVRAMDKGDVQTAEKAFARAAQQDPANPEYDIDRQIAREFEINRMVQQAGKARMQGQFAVARARLSEALALDPQNQEVSQHIGELTRLSSAAQPAADATFTIAPPIDVVATPGIHSFHLSGTEPAVLNQVLGAYGLTVIIDKSVATKIIRFDADDVDYGHAAKLVSLATGSFIVPLDPKRALVAKDTKENHTQYDRMALETLRLPGLTPTEMTDIGNIARTVVGVEQATVQQASETLTVRGPHATLVALNRTLADLLQGRSEVMLDVRVIEVERTKMLNTGLQLPQTSSLFNIPSEVSSVLSGNASLVQQIIASGLASAGDTAAIAAILIASGQVSSSVLTQPFATFGGGLTETGVTVGAPTANLSLNATDDRSLDQVQLQLEDKEEGTVKVGERYPIQTSNYSSIGASSVNIPGLTSAGLSSTLSGLGVNLSSLSSAQTIPQVQYEDLGLTLTVTPSIQRMSDVALKFDFKLTALEGTVLNGLPVLTNESYTANISVKPGASAMIMSDLSSSQSKAVSGVPGLGDLPGFQSATASTTTDLDVSSLVIVITPHLLRRRDGGQVGPFVPLPAL